MVSLLALAVTLFSWAAYTSFPGISMDQPGYKLHMFEIGLRFFESSLHQSWSAAQIKNIAFF